MGAETVRTELKASEDPRVRAGVRAAVEHVGARHGLSKAEQRELADDVDRECHKAFRSHREECHSCDVLIDESEDRLEVSIKRVACDLGGDAQPQQHAATGRSRGPQKQHPKNGNASLHASGNDEICATVVRHFNKHPTHS